MARADGFSLPAPGVLVRLSPPFDPPILTGIKVYPDNPFRFDFILDEGDGSKPSQIGLRDESTKLIKYFLASLTIPEKDLWVNLSPYEKDRIIPQSFGLTEMGRDLLAEDYMLKQVTASLIYPEDEIGKKFWSCIYEEADKKYGTTNISINTFNKVWIVPEKAVVYENAKAGTAYVVESKLKVMLEQDYLSLSHNARIERHSQELGIQNTKDINALGSQIVREIVIPELTKEVNEDRNFAQLRQVYNSLILATWYKKKIKDSILAQVYTDKNKVAGVNIDDPQEKEKIYQRYLKAFKKGVYNYIKDTGTPEGRSVPRKYFSGGVNFAVSSESNTDIGIDGVYRSVYKFSLKFIRGNDLAMVTARIYTAMTVQRQEEWQKVLGIGKEELADAVSEHPPLGGLLPARVRDEWQRELGIGKEDLADAILKQPHLPGYSPARVRDEWQRELGIGEKALAGAIVKAPSIAGLDPARVRDEWQREFGMGKEALAGAIVKHPPLAGYDSARVKEQWRKEFGIGKKVLATAIIKRPQLISRSPARLKSKWKKELGVGKNALAKTIIKHPTLTGYDPVRIRNEWQLELGMSKEVLANAIVKHPPLVGYSPARIRDQWQSDLGIGKENLVNAIVKFPSLTGFSVSENLKPKKDLLVKMGTQESEMINGLVSLAVMNVRLLQLIYNVAQSNGVEMSKNLLKSAYDRLNKKVIILTGKNAVYWIKQHEENEGLIEPVVKEVLGIGPVMVELHLKMKAKTDEAALAQDLGGIDLSVVNKYLKVQNNGEEIKFHIDAAMLQQLQNAPGFVPVIISIQPMRNLKMFLGLDDNQVGVIPRYN